MTEWLVRLQGEKLDLDGASCHFRSAELKVTYKDGSYYLASTNFNSMTNPSEVLKRAKRVLKATNGILKVLVGNDRPVTADGTLRRVGEGGEQEMHVHLAAATATARGQVHAAGVVIKPDGTTESSGQHPTQAESWMAIARQDDWVAFAFSLFVEPKWYRLSNIMDIIEDDVGGRPALKETGWVPKSRITLFHWTANNKEALGEDARHANKREPPKRPMSLPEAEDLIRTLFKKWLETKVE
jgi:hypothetical protein